MVLEPYTTTGQRERARADLSATIVLDSAMEMMFWLPPGGGHAGGGGGMLIACGHVLAYDRSNGTWLQRPCHGAVSAVVPGCSRLIEFVNRFRQALRIRLHVPPDAPVAPKPGQLHGVVDTFFIGNFPQEGMPEDVG